MLGVILDIFVLVVLMRVITGQEEEGFGKPAIIAVLASVCLLGANLAAMNAGASALWIVIGAIAGVGVLVALCCILLLQIEPVKSVIIGVIFMVYKILISIAFAFMFA